MDEAKPTAPGKKRSVPQKILRIFLWIVASLLFLVMLVLILINVPAVQNFARKKVVTYLNQKLKTKVEIGKLDVDFPTSIALKNVYIEDQKQDTLLYGGKLEVDISMLQLLKSDIQIQEISLDNIVAKIKRLPPDSVFNFQFIADAFMGEQQKEQTTSDSSTLQLSIDKILLNNSRIIYYDPLTGNDMDLSFGHFESDIKTFDPTHLLFDIPTITLNGLHGHFNQMEPLQKTIEKSVAEAAVEPDNYLQFMNEQMNIRNVEVAFNSEPAKLQSYYKIGDLTLHPKTFDLKKSIITLNDAALDNSSIKVVIDSKATKEKPKDSVLITDPTPPFKIISQNLAINNSNFQFDDKSSPHLQKGMDYVHLNLKDIDLKASGLEYSLDTTKVSVESASLQEQSGLDLLNLTADFEMNPTTVSLENLLVQTPGSEIKHTAIITYPSLAALQANPGVLGLDIDLENSKLAMKDLLLFVPMLSSGDLPSNGTLYMDARITGQVNNMNFQQLNLRGLTATQIDLTGRLRGLPNPNAVSADLNIRKFKSNRQDLMTLVPPNSIPSNITIPESFDVAGTVNGGMNNIAMNLTMNSTLGGARIAGSLSNPTDQKNANYDLDIRTRNLNVGRLIQNPQPGMLTADVKVKGRGFDPQTAKADFKGTVANVTLNGYNYTNIDVDGNIANKLYNVNASVHDPNLYGDIEASGEFAGTFPSVHLAASIDSIKTMPLGFTPDEFIYHGRIEGDFTNVDPDNLAGDLTVTHSIFVYKGERITLDSISLLADGEGANRSLALKSDIFSASITGNYKITQLADVFQQSIDPYFSLTGTRNVNKVDPYDFRINVGVRDNPAVRAFVPGITGLKPINLQGQFSSDTGWNAYMKAPAIDYNTFNIRDLEFTAQTADSGLALNTSLGQLTSGTSIAMFKTALTGLLHDNKLDFRLNIKDAKDADKYNLAGTFDQPRINNYILSLNPGNLLLNYDPWTIAGTNSISFIDNDLTATTFVLQQNGQQFSINSIGSGRNKPLRLEFTNFDIATITGFVQSDSLLLGGLLNGNAEIRNLMGSPNFTTDLTVQDLSVYQDTLGNLTAKINNNVANSFNADVHLIGRGNDLAVTGNYFLKPDNNSDFNLLLKINAFQMKALEGFTKGAIHDARGFLYGQVKADGSIKDPNIDGKINFNETAFTASAVNNVFKVDKESIAIINNEGILLNQFSIRDTANNAITIDGMLNSTNFYDYSFDLTVKAKQFQAINSTSKDNELFYGKLVFSTNLTITGTPTAPVVDGDLQIDDATDFTVVLPQAQPGVVKREGIVQFVDYSALPEDSLFMQPYDSLNKAPLLGYDISVNITVTKQSTFNLIVDQGNGDFLRLKGDAQLTGGVDPSGKVTLVGSYEIDEGSYQLSFNFIQRKFLIERGSRIVWTGEPTTAQVDVTATYVADAPPVDLVQGMVSDRLVYYQQKLPFDVNLTITGELMKPQIGFDIVLPSDKNYRVDAEVVSNVQTRLTQLRQDPGELNKQVFALLLLNRFVGENPFDNSSGGSLDANTFAKQSVSRLLTEQLNQLTEGLIEGVDINFDLATTDDYTTGSKQSRTDFNIGLSKRLLNDRLTVTVGSNFELEGPRQTNAQQNNVAGNIAIDYKISKDGKYMLRAYRKNDYTAAIQGYVIETGLGFIVTVDYNKFREIFRNKEERRKKREIKKENKEIQKTEEEQNPPIEKTTVSAGK